MGTGNINLLSHEEEIVAAFENQDQSTLGRIYQLLFPKVRRYVLKNSGSVEDSEDLMNEAFMAVYTQILSQKYQLRGRFEPFFMIICRTIPLK